MRVESFFRSTRLLVPFAALPAALLVAAVVAEEQTQSSKRSAEMREIARSIAIVRADREKLGTLDEPLYRFDDPTRDFSDGTVWSFGATGRPAALLTISLKKYSPTSIFWLLEFTSLADAPLRVDGPGSPWNPDKPGLELRPIPDAPMPADDTAKRLVQMRALSRRFTGHELLLPSKDSPRAERYELRLLPRPVHRYRDPDRGLVDGGLFLFAYGQNPEVVLIVEADRTQGETPRWVYGLGRIASAHVTVNLDAREVADFPQLRSHATTDVYSVTVRPSKEGQSQRTAQ